MTNTRKFATPEEIAECQKMVKDAAATPVISFDGKTDMASSAWHRVKERCHEIALSHGLPEIEGFYGMTQDGEFVTA